MTKEEIQEAKMISQEAVTDVMRSPVQTDEVEAAVLLLPKALDALEEANREIERLRNQVHHMSRCADPFVNPIGRGHYEVCPFYAEKTACLGESTT